MLIVIGAASLTIVSCSRPPKLDFDRSTTISQSSTLGIGNLTVLEIDPNGHQPTLRWEAYNKKNGNAFNVPYENLTITAGSERYVVSDRTVGNNALSVNGSVEKFDGERQRLQIRIGLGADVVEGADYQASTKFYEWDDGIKAP
jgi:hypothetical protein